jgi:membrane protease YdiL (CAAX protease family)
MMKLNLSEPRMVAEAREQIRWKHDFSRPVELIIEILIFILVFVAYGVLQGVVSLVGIIPFLFSNESFLSAAGAAAIGGQSTPDFAVSSQIAGQIMQDPRIVIVFLIATLGGIIGVIIYCRAIEGRRLVTLGFRRGHALREYLVGALIGGVLFSLVVLICLISGTLSYEGLAASSTGLLALFLLGFLVQGMSEELLCRGYFMVSLARKQSLVTAIVVSSCFFGVLHFFNSGAQPLAIANVVLFGGVAAVYLLKRGNIWGAAAMHSIWNFVQGNIYGTQVSGLEKMPSLLSFSASESGALINGGAFGLEGGLATTIVLVVALFAALLMRSSDTAPQTMPISDGSAQVVIIPGAQPLPMPDATLFPPPDNQSHHTRRLTVDQVPDGDLGAMLETGLLKYARNMVAHRAVGDEQTSRYPLVGKTLGDERNDFAFALRERREDILL